jgi:hypothetical protein
VNGTQDECWPAPDSRGCPVVDALGTRANGAYFGSYLVGSWDLKDINPSTPGIQYRLTGRCTYSGDPDCGKWGAFVYDPMRYLSLPTAQGGLGKRVTVRSDPIRPPDSLGTNTQFQTAQDIIDLVSPSFYNYNWIKHVQVQNEPNQLGEAWPQKCTNCYWAGNDVPQPYSWDSREDTDLYMAINDFYTDVWNSLEYNKNNHSNATIRARLAAITFWTPPMADIYQKINNDSQYLYEFLHGMIAKYGKMTYHTYPAPNGEDDVDGIGGLKNRSWDFMDDWVKTRITNGTVKTMITEFGWNPGQMILCNMKQEWIWSGSAGACPAADGQTHEFEDDIHRFLTGPQLHNAEAVNVWIVKGWTDETGTIRADGLSPNGTPWWWLHSYQWSNP